MTDCRYINFLWLDISLFMLTAFSLLLNKLYTLQSLEHLYWFHKKNTVSVSSTKMRLCSSDDRAPPPWHGRLFAGVTDASSLEQFELIWLADERRRKFKQKKQSRNNVQTLRAYCPLNRASLDSESAARKPFYTLQCCT